MALGRQGERQADLMIGWAELPRSRARLLRSTAGGAGRGRVRPLRRGGVRGLLRRQAGLAVAAARALLPDAPGRLLRGHRQRARAGVALRRQPVPARVPAARHHRAGAGPLVAYVDGRGAPTDFSFASAPCGASQASRRLELPPAFRTLARSCVGRSPTRRRPSRQVLGRPRQASGSAGSRQRTVWSGQVRPYVRPVARPMPLAIMGVRSRARHQSERRARGAAKSTVSPGLSRPQPFPSRRSALPAGPAGLASAASRAPERYATASAAAAARPVAR